MPWHLTLALVILGVFLGHITQNLIAHLNVPKEGITDRLHLFTSPINHYFVTHRDAANAALITTSLWFDFSVLFLMLRSIFGGTIRPYLGLFLLILIRQSLQFLVSFSLPENIVWRDPGVPSLFVDYSVSNDFYFSGHTGVTLLCALELMFYHKRWLTTLGFVMFAYTISVLICLRFHYTMDIFTAIVVVFCVRHIANKWARPIDHYCHDLVKKFKKPR